MTPSEAALCQLVNDLTSQLEDIACTCPDTDTRNRLHCAPGRRRMDSKCTGVALAVRAEMRKRRALRRRKHTQ